VGLQEPIVLVQLLRDMPVVPVVLPDEHHRDLLLLYVLRGPGCLLTAVLPRAPALRRVQQEVLLRDVLTVKCRN
jgi:hypothetical protein